MDNKNEKSLPVTLEEVNSMVTRYLDFEDSIEKTKKPSDLNFKDTEVEDYIGSKQKNVFIFDKGSIIELLNNNQSEYLIVALGAHEKGMNEQGIKDNSFTVMTIACFEKDHKYFPINIPKPAEEWPHGIKLAKFEKAPEKDNGDRSFFFSITE